MAEETPTQQDDWIVGATDSIIGYVDKARSLGTDKAVTALRVIVFGLVALVFGIAAIIFSVVLLVRFADAYLPIGNGVGDATWAAHLLIGAVLSIIGFGFWAGRKRTGWGSVLLALVVDVLIIVVIGCYGFFS